MLERFMSKVAPEPNCGCWLWTAAGDAKGYGHFGVARAKSDKAHRVSYRLFKGEIPSNMIVCHTCDISACVNPDHLFLGSTQDNMDDRSAKGRTAVGAHNGKSKLTPEIVSYIRTVEKTTIALEKELALHRSTIHAARVGVTWRHVATPPRSVRGTV